MAIKEIVFDGKIWVQKVILSYKVTGKPNSSGIAWVYEYDTVTKDFGRYFVYVNGSHSILTLAHGTLLEVGTERRHGKDWNLNYQYFRKILKCPDYPMAVGNWIAESDITQVN
ncbi:hypothetical protein [Lactobacillus crispatus]|uniref:hypothetical protein n=1 Tax=Lactobacillus crispatus TaxID=47770 RepID=UPI003F25883D